MKRYGWCAAAVAAMALSAAAEKEGPKDRQPWRRGEGGRPDAERGEAMRKEGRAGAGQRPMAGQPPQHRGMLLLHAVQNPEVAETLGLSDEQKARIADMIADLRKQRVRLQADLEIAAIEQVRLLAAPEVNEAAVLAGVEKTGAIRTELAKLEIRPMIGIRKILSAEQLQKARALVRERMQRQMHGGPGADGEPGPGRPDARGPRPGRMHPPQGDRDGERSERPEPPHDDDDAPPPPPPPPEDDDL